MSPLATILWRIRSQSMPRPSSLTVITTLLPRCEARSDTVPARGLPAASRSSGGSSPWSTALRTMWIKRVGELVDHPLVELGLLAADLEDHLLAGGDGSGRG